MPNLSKMRSFEDIKDMITNIELKIDSIRKEISSDSKDDYAHINELIAKKHLLLWVLGDDLAFCREEDYLLVMQNTKLKETQLPGGARIFTIDTEKK